MLVLLVLMIISGIAVHLWTVVIAYVESGMTAAVVSFFLPYLAEIYWIIAMLGDDHQYCAAALMQLLLGSFVYMRSLF
jgi:predicted Kef-type K+ transport protein